MYGLTPFPDWMENALDLAFQRRVDTLVRRVDMGCYEYLHPVSLFGTR